jgi:hypothetical protein
MNRRALGPVPDRATGSPARGRIVTCRRGGCREAATDDMIQLCTIHLANYEHDASRVLALISRAKTPTLSGP